MSDITYGFTCPDCGEDLEAEIVVHSAGHGPTGMHGPPEFSSPGEGPEYSLEKDVVCSGTLDEELAELGAEGGRCKRVFDDDYFQSGKPCDEICEQIASREYDYDGPDTLEERDGDV